MSDKKKDFAEFLREFEPRPAPPGLKRRILAAAEADRRTERFFSVAQRRAAAAFGLLIFVCLAGDAWVEVRSARAVKDLISGNATAAAPESRIDRDLIREISGEDARLERQLLSRIAAEKNAQRRIARPPFGGQLGDI